MKISDVDLSSAQEKRARRIERILKARGYEGTPLAREVESVWRTLYRVDEGEWVRKEVAETSRGFRFAQRPGA